MNYVNGMTSYHNSGDTQVIYNVPLGGPGLVSVTIQQYLYHFENFFHPFVGQLIAQLNQTSVAGMLDPAFLGGPLCTYNYANEYTLNNGNGGNPEIAVTMDPQAIDVTLPGGPYAVYNWEMLYHIPVTIAVQLSNNQRFAEAQKWFHLVFDPTNAEQQYWRSFVFGGTNPAMDLNSLLQLLSTPDSQLSSSQIQIKTNLLTGYNAIMTNPFDPFVVARTRISSFQWYVVMKYLDNLIAWGDSLFLQDTVETLNEATLCYVLAANLLGPQPQPMPQPGTTSPKTFLQLKQAGLDRMSDALIDIEAQFPFNLSPPPGQNPSGNDQSGALFGIGRSLYFCIPPNQTLLAYWDTVADRLFKIRNSENIQGMAQQLPLFDPPLDPGMLVQAAAAGIDIGSIISGLNQPIGPERSLLLIQKSLELATEVKTLGAGLLAALEKGDAEHLAQLRQGHEVLQQMTQNVRFLQWKHAEESTNALLASRATALERHNYYLRLLGQTPDSSAVPPTLTADRTELTEANWSDTYNALVGEYTVPVPTQAYSKLQLAQGSSPSQTSGASGQGPLFLITNEDTELNTNLPNARDERLQSNIYNTVAAGLAPVPSVELHLAYWGLGGHSNLVSGLSLSSVPKFMAELHQVSAAYATDQAGIAARTGGHQRRVDEWTLQANLAADELMAIGRQVLASLIAEQVAKHEYTTVQTQVQQAQAVQTFLQTKFTNEAFYDWMQSDISGLYYQYYRFACDTARRAEQTVTHASRTRPDAIHSIQLLGLRPPGAAVRRGAVPGHQAPGDGLSRQQQARDRNPAARLAAPARSGSTADIARYRVLHRIGSRMAV